jgi:hypothetical protein
LVNSTDSDKFLFLQPKNVNSALHYALTGTPSYGLVDLLLREVRIIGVLAIGTILK